MNRLERIEYYTAGAIIIGMFLVCLIMGSTG